jgi:hypothetical protein
LPLQLDFDELAGVSCCCSSKQGLGKTACSDFIS